MQKINKQSGFSIIEIGLVILVIGLMGVIGFLVWQRVQKPEVTGQRGAASRQAESNEQQLQPSAVIEKIKSDLASRYSLVEIDVNNNPAEGEMSVRQEKAAPAWKPEGYSFYTSHSDGASLDMMPHNPSPSDYSLPKTADRQLRSDVVKTYESFGLQKNSSIGSNLGGGTTDLYLGKGLVCAIEEVEAATSSNHASCGVLSAYKAAADTLRVFADKLPVDLKDSDTLYLGVPRVIDSRTPGYQRAEVSVGHVDGGGAMGLFYRKGSGAWIYFKSVQDAPACSSFDTPDLKNAFRGEACYSATTNSESTVQ